MSRLPSIYVLHEYGSPAHYSGLARLLETRGGTLTFVEFGVMRQFARGLRRRQASICRRSLRNVLLLLRLMFFAPRSKIVLGIAPFDSSVLLLLLLARHALYLHSSWPYWDLSKQPHTPWKPLRGPVFVIWRLWLQRYLIHAFFVTQLAQQNNQASSFPCAYSSVVHHSFDPRYFYADEPVTRVPPVVRIAYVGRLEQPKGILDFLEVASLDFPFAVEFHIAGQGDQLPIVEAAVASNPGRVFYSGYLSHPEKLASFFRRMDFLLTPSHKTGSWEELFGMTLIEAGACGVISYATNHPGPLEILADSPAGGCLPENDFVTLVAARICRDIAELQQNKQRVASYFARYSVDAVANLWGALLADSGAPS